MKHKVFEVKMESINGISTIKTPAKNSKEAKEWVNKNFVGVTKHMAKKAKDKK